MIKLLLLDTILWQQLDNFQASVTMNKKITALPIHFNQFPNLSGIAATFTSNKNIGHNGFGWRFRYRTIFPAVFLSYLKFVKTIYFLFGFIITDLTKFLYGKHKEKPGKSGR